MKEHPILFSGEMVRAILEGWKTQTRRVVKPRIIPVVEECFRVNGKWCNHTFDYDLVELSPHGKPGDRLWVREAWRTYKSLDHVKPSSLQPGAAIEYLAGGSNVLGHNGTPLSFMGKGRPSIFMPRWASRITLEVTNMRLERLNEITQDDAVKEGCDDTRDMIIAPGRIFYADGPRDEFRILWDSINAKRGFGWETNPWVWVIEFRRVS